MLKFARPDVSRLMMQTFGRTVHPELITIHETREFATPQVQLRVDILDAGHLLTVRVKDCVCSEILTTTDTLLPLRYRWLTQRVSGPRDGAHAIPGLEYYTSCDLEVLESEIFARYQTELLCDALHAPVSHSFRDGNRFRIAPLSFVQVETTPHSLQVHTCHSFPDNLAVVKSQSRWEF